MHKLALRAAEGVSFSFSIQFILQAILYAIHRYISFTTNINDTRTTTKTSTTLETTKLKSTKISERMSDTADFEMRAGHTTYSGPSPAQKWYNRILSKVADKTKNASALMSTVSKLSKAAYKAVRPKPKKPKRHPRREEPPRPRSTGWTSYCREKGCVWDGAAPSLQTAEISNPVRSSSQRPEETSVRATPIQILAPIPTRPIQSSILSPQSRTSPSPGPSPDSTTPSDLPDDWCPSPCSSVTPTSVPSSARLAEPYSEEFVLAVPPAARLAQPYSDEVDCRMFLNHQDRLDRNSNQAARLAEPYSDDVDCGMFLAHQYRLGHRPAAAATPRRELPGHALATHSQLGPFSSFSSISSKGFALARTSPKSDERPQRPGRLRRQGAVRVHRINTAS